MGSKIQKNNSENKSFKSQEFYIIKDSIAYKFIVEKLKNDILIKHQNYSVLILLSIKNLSLLTKSKKITIDKLYNIIINEFKNNNVVIQNIDDNNSIKLLLKINKIRNFEINLLYNENESKEDIFDNKSIIEISKDSYAYLRFDNTFCVFKSINDILYLLYSNSHKSIISYDLIDNKKINEIKKAHNYYITNFRHYFENINKRDLILSISCQDNNIKLWNINNYDLLLNIKDINSKPSLNSACFLKDDNQNYILTTNCNWANISDSIKVFNFNGKKIKEIKNSNDRTLLIDIYYDNKSSKIYILTANDNKQKAIMELKFDLPYC